MDSPMSNSQDLTVIESPAVKQDIPADVYERLAMVFMACGFTLSTPTK